ncbi:shTK domain protein, partial [Teladorsagia circumcincta]
AADDNPVTVRFHCQRGCCDHHEWCRFWASVGECRSNREWMADNCQLVCGSCRPGSARTSRPPDASSLARPPPRMPRPGTNQASNPRNPRPSGRRPSSRTPQRDRPSVQARAQDRRPQRPASTTLPRTTPRTTQRILPFSRATRPLRTRPNSSTTTRRPPPPPPTTRPAPSTTRAPSPTTTTRAPVRSNTPNAARCQAIMQDPLVSAEEMWREKLVVSTEGQLQECRMLDSGSRSLLQTILTGEQWIWTRTMDGTCNNLQHPLRGAAYRPYTRLLPTVYDNGLSEPVGSMNPQMRPSPRAITRHLTSSHASVVSEDYNAMVMQFGQFISHDMAKTTLVPSAKCNVCQNITSRCMAVSIASDDPNAGFRRNGCVRVSRSSPICGSGNQKPRQQLNENTAYLDASPIYGSSVADMAKFREGRTGFLKLPSFHGMSMLPFDQSKCRSRTSCTEFYQRLDPNFGNSSFGALALQKGTLHSDVLVNEGGPDPLVRGMFTQNVKRPQRVTTTVTENMFGSTDLSTINIQRGRDHGHPSYSKYRELCGMGVATSFDHMSQGPPKATTQNIIAGQFTTGGPGPPRRSEP